MFRFLVSIVLLVSAFHVSGQTTFTVSGKITSVDNQPVAGATIHLLNTNYGTSSDAEGRFEINALQGRYNIQISAVGYVSAGQLIEVSGKSSALSIQLTEATTQLDAVVVTAQKTEEELQKVPFSTSAISSMQVQQYRIWNSKDITAIVPNLYSASPGDGRNVTSIRGITSTSYDPSVATYIDGVNQFGLDTYIAQLSDIERIEVLRGPQGTLYGRNAMGGVINIITKQPSNRTVGFGEINLGNYGQQRYSLGVRTPLIKDKLFLGLSGMYDRSNGFYTNEYNDSHFDKKHSVMGNYYLKYLVNSSWAFTLNLKHNQNRNNGTFPLASSVDDAFEKPFKVNQNAVATMVDNIFNSSLAASYSGARLSFSSQTTYQSNYRYYKNPIDGDFSPIDGVTIINNYGKQWNNVKVITEEFKFSSPASSSSPFQWTAGTYLFYQHNPVKQATYFGADAAYVGAPDTFFSTISTTTGKSAGAAFYGQATYHINEQLYLIGGLRYDYEHKKQNVLGEYQKDPDPKPMFETRPDTSAIASFHAVSPKLGLAYQPQENTNLYLTYSRGFRAGGLTQLSSDPSQPPLFTYKPEYSNNVEAGFKQTYLNNRLRTNVAFFYIRANDVQVPTLVLPEAFTITKNAGQLTSKGFDIELSSTPVAGLQIDYNFGYTNAKFDELRLSQNGSEVNLKGNQQLFTPKTTSMFALQYGFNLGTESDLKFIVRGEWMYLGEQYFNLSNTIKQSPYSLFNTRFGFSGKGFEIMFWGRNLSNEKYISYAYDFGATHLGDPKNYGVTLRKNF